MIIAHKLLGEFLHLFASVVKPFAGDHLQHEQANGPGVEVRSDPILRGIMEGLWWESARIAGE